MEHTPAVGGTGTLVDIRDVTVDWEPYRFKCGRFTVHASFASGGATLEECIKGILR